MKCKFLCIPLDQLVITQKFGENPQMYRKYGMSGHNGVDFRTKFPDTPLGRREIYAVDDGIVSKVVIAKLGGYGTYVQITHDDGSMTIYGHQYRPHVVKGQRVKAGQIIGISDNTGDSTGAHLHFGLRLANANMRNGFKGYIDPLPYLNI